MIALVNRWPRSSQEKEQDHDEKVKGCWCNNIFVERLWRTIKYDDVYLESYELVAHGKTSLGQFITFYKSRRPHQAFSGKIPGMIYFTDLPQKNLAA